MTESAIPIPMAEKNINNQDTTSIVSTVTTVKEIATPITATTTTTTASDASNINFDEEQTAIDSNISTKESQNNNTMHHHSLPTVEEIKFSSTSTISSGSLDDSSHVQSKKQQHATDGQKDDDTEEADIYEMEYVHDFSLVALDITNNVFTVIPEPEHSLPTVEELKTQCAIHTYENGIRKRCCCYCFYRRSSKANKSCCCTKRWIIWFLILLTFIAVTVVITSTGRHVTQATYDVPTTANNTDLSSSSPEVHTSPSLSASSSTSNMSVSTSATTKPSTNNTDTLNGSLFPITNYDKKFADIVTLLTQRTHTSTVQQLRMVGSHQYQAVQWMVYHDEYLTDVPSNNEHLKTSTADATAAIWQFVQRYIMIVFFYSLNGQQWHSRYNYLSKNQSVCDWNGGYNEMGIYCNDHREIIKISLPGNNLKGAIPSEIGMIRSLQELTLYKNSVSHIPDTIDQLYKSLTYLHLGVNELYGGIPSWLTKLYNIEYLSFQDNDLTGTIPYDVFRLTNLREIDLSGNALTGQGLAPFDDVNCPYNLTVLDLHDNFIDGTIDDSSFAYCNNLRELDLGFNNITGTFPQHFYNYNIVNLKHNKISGPLYTVPLFNSFRIQYLSVSNNAITGTLPSTLGYLRSLQHLDVSNNQLKGSLNDAVHNQLHPVLEYLFVSNNLFSPGKIPDLLNYKSLLEVSFAATNRVGTIPSWIGDIVNITLLDFHDNQLHGTIPSTIGNLYHLQHLFLNDNQLNGTVPLSFTYLTDTNRIMFLDNNSLQGSLEEICSSRIDMNYKYAADCASSSSSVDAHVNCSCCEVCCISGDSQCNRNSEKQYKSMQTLKPHSLRKLQL